MNDFDTRLAGAAAFRNNPLETMHGDDAYRALDSSNEERVDAFLRAHGREEQVAFALRNLLRTPGFQQCGPAAQAALLDAALEHPSASTFPALSSLAADGAFQHLQGPDADAEADRAARGITPPVRQTLERAGMPRPEPHGIGVAQGVELAFQVLDYVEGVAGVEVPYWIGWGVGYVAGPDVGAAAAPIVGGALAGASAVLGIYSGIHGAEQAHEEGREIGEAAAWGAAFSMRLQGAVEGADDLGRPRNAPEQAADRAWQRMRPSERAVLRDPTQRAVFFAALRQAVIDRASGR